MIGGIVAELVVNFVGNDKDFFFTFWNYETLQLKWAVENGLKTRNLDEIRIAQIEEFKPDVYYNFSTYYDNEKLRSILKRKDLISVCWDATIGTYFPPLHENYHIRATLFEPFFKKKMAPNRKHVIQPFFVPTSVLSKMQKSYTSILLYIYSSNKKYV